MNGSLDAIGMGTARKVVDKALLYEKWAIAALNITSAVIDIAKDQKAYNLDLDINP
jgi:hypothetical protein